MGKAFSMVSGTQGAMNDSCKNSKGTLSVEAEVGMGTGWRWYSVGRTV